MAKKNSTLYVQSKRLVMMYDDVDNINDDNVGNLLSTKVVLGNVLHVLQNHF